MKLARAFAVFVILPLLGVEEYVPNRSQGVIFIVDRNNSDYVTMKNQDFTSTSAGTDTLEEALKNNIPLIVSTSLVSCWFKYHSKRGVKKDENFLEKWKIYESEEDFCIIIPKNSSLENIGFKKLREFPLDQAYDYEPGALYNITWIDIVLRGIFQKDSQVSWMVFLVGHGAMDQSIAGMSIFQFQRFLTFLNNKIITKILLYDSCYAGGLNKIDGFKDELGFQRNFSFPIIVLSSTDATTSGDILNPVKYDQLFSLLAENTFQLPDYYKILSDTNFLKPRNAILNSKQISLSSFPQIRLPGAQWFSVDGLNAQLENKDYFVISKIKGKTRKKELKIKKTVKAIFLYSPVVPFSLIIPHSFYADPLNDTQLRFLYMDSGNAYHFKEIDAQNLTFKNLCELFAPLSDVKDITLYIDILNYDAGTLNDCVLKMYKDPAKAQDFVFDLYTRQENLSERVSSSSLSDSKIKGFFTERKAMQNFSFDVPEELKFKHFDELEKVIEKRIKKN